MSTTSADNLADPALGITASELAVLAYHLADLFSDFNLAPGAELSIRRAVTAVSDPAQIWKAEVAANTLDGRMSLRAALVESQRRTRHAPARRVPVEHVEWFDESWNADGETVAYVAMGECLACHEDWPCPSYRRAHGLALDVPAQ